MGSERVENEEARTQVEPGGEMRIRGRGRRLRGLTAEPPIGCKKRALASHKQLLKV